MSDAGEITRLLERLDSEQGEERDTVLQELMPMVYGELKALARANRYRWSGVESLGTTSLVHEAYLKLADQSRTDFANRRRPIVISFSFSSSIHPTTVNDPSWANPDDDGPPRGGLHRRSSVEGPAARTVNPWGGFVPTPARSLPKGRAVLRPSQAVLDGGQP